MDFFKILQNLEGRLRAVAWTVTGNKEDQNDLMQEMRIYLWKNKEKLKDKTEAYLFKACYFQARHYLNQGKSIDSKLRQNLTIISLRYNNDKDNTEILPIPTELPNPRDVLMAQDLENRIRQHLSQKLTQTYDLLLKGYSPVEIAERFNLTCEAIRLRIKKIRKIVRSYL